MLLVAFISLPPTITLSDVREGRLTTRPDIVRVLEGIALTEEGVEEGAKEGTPECTDTLPMPFLAPSTPSTLEALFFRFCSI
jgi:hypothetical protein